MMPSLAAIATSANSERATGKACVTSPGNVTVSREPEPAVRGGLAVEGRCRAPAFMPGVGGIRRAPGWKAEPRHRFT